MSQLASSRMLLLTVGLTVSQSRGASAQAAQGTAAAAPPADSRVTIAHDSVGCFVAGKFPRIDARLDPADRVSRARTYFRAGGGSHWYYVEMTASEGAYSAVLPKPKKETETVEYYVEALDRAFEASRTAEFTPRVSTSPTTARPPSR